MTLAVKNVIERGITFPPVLPGVPAFLWGFYQDGPQFL